jgi:AMP-binding enzyme
VAEFTQTIDIDQLAICLPQRLHLAAERHIAEAPDRIALIEDGRSWTYRELGRNVGDIADRLAALGIKAGDRMIIVSENCIALAGCSWPQAGSTPGRSSRIRASPHARSIRSASTGSRPLRRRSPLHRRALQAAVRNHPS